MHQGRGFWLPYAISLYYQSKPLLVNWINNHALNLPHLHTFVSLTYSPERRSVHVEDLFQQEMLHMYRVSLLQMRLQIYMSESKG